MSVNVQVYLPFPRVHLDLPELNELALAMRLVLLERPLVLVARSVRVFALALPLPLLPITNVTITNTFASHPLEDPEPIHHIILPVTLVRIPVPEIVSSHPVLHPAFKLPGKPAAHTLVNRHCFS
jgi:hypothetical protein